MIKIIKTSFVFLLVISTLLIPFLYWRDVSSFYRLKQEKHRSNKIRNQTNLKYKLLKNETLSQQDIEHWMIQREEIYSKDKERIREVCKRYSVPARKIIDKMFLKVDHYHKLALCTHPKVGSTTWRTHLKDILPNNIREKLTQKFGQRSLMAITSDGKWILDNYFSITKSDVTGGLGDWLAPITVNNFLKRDRFLSFSFVRHPYERLVSAYNDKIDQHEKKTNFKMISSAKKALYEKLLNNDYSFSSFVNLVLYEYRTSCFPGKTQTSYKLPTNYHNKNCENKVNAHWRPFVFECSYCDINYDLIGRMETWNEDFNYIIRKAGLEKLLPLQQDDSLHYHSSKQNTEKMTKAYFSKLSKKQKEDLYHMFRMDFDMFNYDPKIY